ncbi:HNH endonuclease [Lactobacillus helveticus]|uniref:HNH endonuclease n=1 Tax=Lactobacillus helveticus TaxID=1587 RepID=UPI001562C247|nr:HNH endonuclease [Lactobacillus helveticus]NRO27733.1 hypothetical protein [Lactobacillus helveticus]
MTNQTNKKGQFVKGMTPWNKGKHNIPGGRSVETRFKKGLIPPNYQPVGTVVVHSDGYRFIKLAEHKWQLYQRYIWEKANHEQLKKNQVVLFLDGNRNNYAPDNLMAISRKELLIINHEKLLTKNDGELSKTGVLIAKLKLKTKEKIKND